MDEKWNLKMKFRTYPNKFVPGLILNLRNPPQADGFYGKVKLLEIKYDEWNVEVLKIHEQSAKHWHLRKGSIFHFFPRNLRKGVK